MRTAAARPRSPDAEPPPAWGLELIAEVRALRLALAPHLRGSIDGDAAVGKAIAELGLTRRPYSARELFALASTDATLRLALDGALIDGAAQLGSLLGRLYKRNLINREPRRAAGGWRWIV